MNGIICIDKPQNMTSFSCCAVVRWLFGEKAGHAGTLDPMATGVLPVMVGKATRALPFLPTHDKRYSAALKFGYESDTLDVWGKVRETGGRIPSASEASAALTHFRGEILQIPPMTSALKKDGVRLYELARRGVEIPREARTITVYELTVSCYDEEKGILQLDCFCSAGTYIRTLCDDLGRLLGCGAVMTALRRTWAAGFSPEQCVTPEQARALWASGDLARYLTPVDRVFSDCPAVTVTEAQAVRFSNGGGLALERLPFRVEGRARVYAPSGEFIGLGAAGSEQLSVLRLF